MWQFPPLINPAFLCVWRRGMVYLGAKAWVVSDESLCHVAGMEILLHVKSENLNVGFILESPIGITWETLISTSSWIHCQKFIYLVYDEALALGLLKVPQEILICSQG